MKESAKSSDKLTRGAIFILYVTLFLVSITYVSMIQINVNVSTIYNLNIEYEEHTCTGNGFSLDNSYNTIIVNIPMLVHDYESKFSGIRVGNFPFWVDTSDWTEGKGVSISGNLYTITSEVVEWRLSRSLDDYGSEIINYNKRLGIFIESHTNWLSLGASGFSGSEVDIEIKQDNLNGFLARLEGSNVIAEIAFISGIFAEILIIHFLWERRKGSSSPKQESN